MQIKRQPLLSFDSRSVMLFAALTLGGTAAVHAQTAGQLHPPGSAVPAEKSGSSRFTTGGTPSAGTGTTATTSAVDVFERADTNRDGQLSPQEATHVPAIAQRFKELDKDGNGLLSRSEFQKGAGS